MNQHPATDGASTPRSPFDIHADRDVIDLIGEYPLAWVMPRASDAGLPSLLPLLAETDETGRLAALVGHLSRSNPLASALERDPHALILFTGPQAYVSPAMVSDPGWAPTWNYAQARIEGHVRFEGMAHEALAMLIAAMEHQQPTGWTSEAMGPRYAPMERAIVAFRVEVTRIEGRFKLGQDERPERLREIVERHPDAALVRWMRRMNAARL